MSNAIRLLEIYLSLFWYEFPVPGERDLLFQVLSGHACTREREREREDFWLPVILSDLIRILRFTLWFLWHGTCIFWWINLLLITLLYYCRY